MKGMMKALNGHNDSANEIKRSTGQEKPSDGIYNIMDFGAKGDGILGLPLFSGGSVNTRLT